MTLETACADRREAIAALVVGVLAKPEADALRLHFAQCEGCRRLCESMTTEEKDVLSAFDAIGQRAKDLQGDIIERLATVAPQKRLSGADAIRVTWLRRLGILAAAALIIIAVVFAASVLIKRQAGDEADKRAVVEGEKAPTHIEPGPPAPSDETELAMADRLFAAHDVDGLVDLLTHGTPKGRIAAANYLAKIGDARALGALQSLSQTYGQDKPDNPFAAAITAIQTRLAAAKEKPSTQEKQEPNAPVTPVAAKAVETVTYAGTVRNQAGEPIEGVAVRSWLHVLQPMPTEFKGWELTATTDREGRFDIGPLPVADPQEDQYRTLIFEHPQYAIGWFSPYWGSNRQADPRKIGILLLEPTTFSGTVVDADGKPVEGALVEAELQVSVPIQYSYFNMDRTNGLGVRTDAKGRFTLGKIPVSTRLHVNVSRDGYVHYSSRESFKGDMYPMRPGQDVQVELTPGATLRGQIVLHGQPYKRQGLAVSAREENGYSSGCATDSDGRFEMSDLSPGTYTAAVSYESIAKEGLFCRPVGQLEVGITMPARTVEIHLEEGIPVVVTLLDLRSGKPAKDEFITIGVADTIVAAGRTDEKGQYVGKLGAGQYKLSARGWKDGRWAQFSKDFTVAGDAKELTVSMEIAVRPMIQGCLVDSLYRPLRGTVLISSEDRVQTHEDGTFACPEPLRSPGDVEVGYAFDEAGTLGRAFFWKPGGEPNFLEIVAKPLVSITGRIVDANDAGVSDVTPKLNVLLGGGTSRGARNTLWQTSVEDDGRFQLTGVPAGLPMRLSVDKPSFQGGVQLPTLEPGRTIDVGDVILKPLHGFAEGKAQWTGTLSGRVINEANEPMVGLKVRSSMGMQTFEDVTDLQGRYILKGLPRGKRISGSVYADGYGHTMFLATLDGNDLEIKLFPQGWELLNKPAPGLFVDKWINTENVTLEQYRGKVVVLQIGVLLPNYTPDLERMTTLLNEYGSQGLQVIAIHQRLDVTWAGKVTEDDLRTFVAAHAITFPFAIDAPVDTVRDLVGDRAVANGAMYSLYDVKATPALYLIDKKGILRISPKHDELDTWIKRLLGE